jgi:hypothetical protein
MFNSVRSHKMLYRNTYKNWETALRFKCHYDLFSQISRLKKVTIKRSFLFFYAVSGFVHEDLSKFYFCRRHKFAIKYCCATLDIFVYLRVTCRSATQTEYIVKFHIIFTVHSVLYNSFYFNQHMHYNFVVVYIPTYVSITY